ncbi:MAG TPA: outer membrane beta-barrel protein [Gemmatimonadales bacterium]|nr:outer membrane beta-barrel protein [Gemmatimonadales bacterium]
MRKRSLIAGAALVLGMQGTLLAQPEIGIKGGASFGNISNKGILPGNLKTRTGLAGGLYLGSGGVIGIGVEGLYAQRGAESDEPIATSETRLDFIDVPGYVKVRIPTPGIKPFVYAGPQVSYEVKCRTAVGGDCADYSTSDRKRWTFAGIIGAGIRIGAGIGLGIEGRYVYGLTDLKPSTVTSSSSYKDRSFMLLGSIGR